MLQKISIRKALIGFSITVMVVMLLSIFLNYQQLKVADEMVIEKKEEILPHAFNFLYLKLDVIQVQQWLTDISATKAKDGFDDGFQEAKKYLFDNFSCFPWQLVTLEQLKEDREFGKYFNELETLRVKYKELQEKYQQELQDKNTEINELKKEKYINTASKRLENIFQMEQYPENMKKFISKAYETSKDKISDLSDVGLKSYVDSQKTSYQNFMSIMALL